MKVTKTDLAKLLGVSNAYISRCIKKGKITPDSTGRLDLEACVAILKPDRIDTIHMEQVNEIQRNRDKPGPKTNSLTEVYNKARAQKAVFDAKIKELEFKQMEGTLIPLSDVIEDAAKTGEEIRATLLAIPSRIAPALDGKTAVEIEAAITEAINEALTILHETRFK